MQDRNLKEINIQNVRLGFNTSSSSQHSAVINVNKRLKLGPVTDGYYGWNDFILKTKEEKEHYFVTMLFINLSHTMPAHYAAAIVNDLFGKKYVVEGDEPGFDHQSLFSLPVLDDDWLRHGVKEINLEFFKEMTSYFADNPKIAICGGNDNERRPRYGREDKVFQKLHSYMADSGDTMRARKDGDFWVLFNKRTGAKIRFSFTSRGNYDYSTFPESADIKITDFCDQDCDWCYQASTREGKFSHTSNINYISRALQRMGVFEVAIGGGEPTLHPELPRILKTFKDDGMCVNLTTSSTKWIENPVLAKAILQNVSGIAFSANRIWDIEKVHAWLKLHNYQGEFSTHIILGRQDRKSVV